MNTLENLDEVVEQQPTKIQAIKEFFATQLHKLAKGKLCDMCGRMYWGSKCDTCGF